jgi:hypothetical protein
VSGLTDGERILAQPPDTLRDGQRVRAVDRRQDKS